jgi:putative copper export protein
VPAAHFASVVLHVVAAVIWLGGLFFLGLVGAPVIRNEEPAALRQHLFHVLGLRFRTVGWTALAVLVLTGFVNLQFRGLLHWRSVLAERAFWATPLGRALAVKLLAVAAMVVVSFFHDWIYGPRSGLVPAESTQAAGYRRRAVILARINVLLALVIVASAVLVARGG